METKRVLAVFSGKLAFAFTRAFIVAGFLLCASRGQAQFYFGGTTNTPLNSWSFLDQVSWTSDSGTAPISFTNLRSCFLGCEPPLVVDTNLPAWLKFNVNETSGATNLTTDIGTLMFWFAPASWSSLNAGGSGPGSFSRLIEVGHYTPDSSSGWWSLFVDDTGNHLFFSAQTNDFSSNVTTYVSSPISWKTNFFHFIALTYSTTNTALYLDGILATNGPAVAVRPGPSTLAQGFYIGSATNGTNQAHGLFNLLATFNSPLSGDTIFSIFNSYLPYFMMNPLNIAMSDNSVMPSSPSYRPNYNAMTGLHQMTSPSAMSDCVSSTNGVWITNLTVSVSGTSRTVTFGIAGGQDGQFYDVFANSELVFGSDNPPWKWLGQGPHCRNYSISNLPDTACFLILGSSQNTDDDGLTDAYELLVSHTDPNNPDTDGDGWTDSEEVLNGTDPLTTDQPFKVFITRPGLYSPLP